MRYKQKQKEKRGKKVMLKNRQKLTQVIIMNQARTYRNPVANDLFSPIRKSRVTMLQRGMKSIGTKQVAEEKRIDYNFMN